MKAKQNKTEHTDIENKPAFLSLILIHFFIASSVILQHVSYQRHLSSLSKKKTGTEIPAKDTNSLVVYSGSDPFLAQE